MKQFFLEGIEETVYGVISAVYLFTPYFLFAFVVKIVAAFLWNANR